jgi:tRNA nucleotidyltransferase (CCA-adding enzyme)
MQDAERRDLTINALFYNVHSKQVEDHTGKGLDDLERKIARTPLPPRQTFHDDPLRVLRCVRFASRFGLQIEEEVAEAIRDVEVQVRNPFASYSPPSTRERLDSHALIDLTK